MDGYHDGWGAVWLGRRMAEALWMLGSRNDGTARAGRDSRGADIAGVGYPWDMPGRAAVDG